MQNVTDIKNSMTIRIESCHSSLRVDLDCLVLPVIISRLSQVNINKRLILPEDNRIADPDFDKTEEIDLLIGASLFWNLLCVGQIKRRREHPTWQKTLLGWIIGGELVDARPSASSTSLVVTNQTLCEHLEKF